MRNPSKNTMKRLKRVHPDVVRKIKALYPGFSSTNQNILILEDVKRKIDDLRFQMSLKEARVLWERENFPIYGKRKD